MKLENLAEVEAHHDCFEKMSVSWSPDATLIASGSDRDTTVTIWNSSSLQPACRIELPPGNSCIALAWGNGSKQLAVLSGKVYFFNASTGACEKDMLPMVGRPFAMDWSRNGEYLAVAGYFGNIGVLDLKSGRSHELPQDWRTEAHGSSITALSWRPDSNQLVSAGTDTRVITWNRGEWAPNRRRNTWMGIESLAWSPAGERFAVGAECVYLYGQDSGQPKRIEGYPSSTRVTSLAWHPDGQTLAVGLRSGELGSKYGSLHVYSPQTLKKLWAADDIGPPVTSLSWRPGGSALASGSVDGVLRLWAVAR